MVNKTKKCIDQITTLNYEELPQNYTFAEVTKEKKKPKNSPREKGVRPFDLEPNNQNFPVYKNLKKKVQKSPKMSPHQRNTPKKEENNKNHLMKIESYQEFNHIAPSVREINGGDTHSNEAIERRMRERKQKYLEKNIDLNSSDSNATYTTSETSDSYKTTFQDSFELNKQAESEKYINDCAERYKRNILITGLLRETQLEYPDRQETSTNSSSEFLDATRSVDDIDIEMQNMTISEDKAMLYANVGRLLQSQEDEDLYVHPLKEGLKDDREWQQHRLARKGVETIQSARQYYLGLHDDCFEFQAKT